MKIFRGKHLVSFTSKKRKKEMWSSLGPYSSSSSRKKKKLVSEALMKSGYFRAILIKFNRSLLESRPRQNALSTLFSHFTFGLDWTDSISNVTLLRFGKLIKTWSQFWNVINYRPMHSSVASVIS